MKNFIALLLCLTLLFTYALTTYAEGDPNMDGGGGGTEDGTKTNSWNIGDDGVRVTIVREDNKSAVTTPLDFSNKNPIDINMYFGLRSKLDYKSKSLKPITSNHEAIKPATPIPAVVNANGGGNIVAVKTYFSDEGNLRGMCEQIGFDFDELISGEYVLMIEPLVYITYNGIKFCMTATEAALYDRMTSGDLKSKLGNITHQNLPLAMFLEKPDLGFPAWGGASSGIRSNEDIISSLGIGTVRFSEGACCNHAADCPCIADHDHPNECECKKNHPDQPCGPDTPNCDCVPADDPDTPSGGVKYYDYHTDTDVITTIEVKDTKGGKSGISPDEKAKVTFHVNGNTYTKSFVTPPHESTLLWIKWHTPSTPQKVTINVSTTHGQVTTPTVIANVTELTESTPPDPQPTDERNGFTVSAVPSRKDVDRLTWGEWLPKWHENWEWESDWHWVSKGHSDSCKPDCTKSHGGKWVDRGKYVDNGWWVYTWKEYYASITAETTVTPAREVPTAYKRSGKYTMKSGYGVNIKVSSSVVTNAKNDDVTGAQNAITTFPEFQYTTYNRVMEKYHGTMRAEFQLKTNKYSYRGANSHYTPLWYPDGAQYAPQTEIIDTWTPAGQLIAYGDDYVNIEGDCYDDWNVRPVK
ncbi:hypothetical protein EDD70_0523 [Hydrogenoanaerobacterium saccharovorans]|uniref:Uncharacterized protein n=1 Tax=Hydrogenoanaerobacterium saccharovorans TaxID=474960 RepID=A0A1H8AY87_9FIRM|nr:hypothetical protein [Hydrogenoanaerobacterium saccharovorans]RPF47724.1 hypothetical protein EDD70_0523 [Hydrogenoanaerobacterium saccharovorans]SEM74738.1 hypothetical protein SAMN05216180_1568 [Hydrogenoanaerobacterium saccharovorans]